LNFAESVVSIELGGKTCNLRFNANTMVSYEAVTGKMFLDTVAILYDVIDVAKKSVSKAAVEPIKIAIAEGNGDLTADAVAEDSKLAAVSAFDIIRKVPMQDLRALIWASLHEYGKNPTDPDEPSWPMTIGKVGRMIQLQDIPRIFSAFLRGQIKNSPSKEELGESRAPSEAASSGDGRALRTAAVGGGERSINLPEDAFA
jgi:hypothetical protein